MLMTRQFCTYVIIALPAIVYGFVKVFLGHITKMFVTEGAIFVGM